MRNKMNYVLIMLLSFLLIGCTYNESEIEQPNSAQHISFLRSVDPELTEEEAEEYPDYYSINFEGEEVSVVHSIGEEMEYYELQAFNETEETIVFVYNSQTVTFEQETDHIYLDEFGNSYQMTRREMQNN